MDFLKCWIPLHTCIADHTNQQSNCSNSSDVEAVWCKCLCDNCLSKHGGKSCYKLQKTHTFMRFSWYVKVNWLLAESLYWQWGTLRKKEKNLLPKYIHTMFSPNDILVNKHSKYQTQSAVKTHILTGFHCNTYCFMHCAVNRRMLRLLKEGQNNDNNAN